MGWLNWTWTTGTSVRYCFKAALAGLAGFVLSVGDTWSALFGTFSAALVVGESRGEDTGAAVNRVRGTLVGMVVALASVFAELPQLTAVAAGIGATAYLCMGFGWGVSAARVGASLCAAIVLSHSADAFYYTPMRALNTLIGIGCGLAISYFVMPVRGRDALIRSAKAALKMTAKLLESLAGHDQRAVEECGSKRRSIFRQTTRTYAGRKQILSHFAVNYGKY